MWTRNGRNATVKVITGVLSTGKYFNGVSKDCSALILSVSLGLFGLEDYKGTAIFRNLLNYLPVDTA
jgi:hypothetical protein